MAEIFVMCPHAYGGSILHTEIGDNTTKGRQAALQHAINKGKILDPATYVTVVFDGGQPYLETFSVMRRSTLVIT